MIDSPCIGVCKLSSDSASLICAGCHRTLSEITRWPRMTDEEKARLLETIGARKEQLLSVSPPAGGARQK